LDTQYGDGRNILQWVLDCKAVIQLEVSQDLV